MKRLSMIILIFVLCAVFYGCGTDELPDETQDIQTETSENIQPEESAEISPETATEKSIEQVEYTLPRNFKYPATDGSTSTIPLDTAVRAAVTGISKDEAGLLTAHTKTYESLRNLAEGKCDVIFTTPLSDDQINYLGVMNFTHEAEPIAGEGFVFVVNKDNPVESLTVEQIRDIYSGKITNWSEVGGNDADIIAYQRNSDSGSQNYMLSFMGETPLMEPVTDIKPRSMGGILDVIAKYDNGIDAIGYSVYAYSDGMYEDVAKIKYIKVNGVEPSLKTLADGSYPLLGYNYAVFSADEAEDSDVRALIKWMQSDAGQQVIADAGYVPYRKVAGLTLPEPTLGKLYTAVGTGCEPEEIPDYRFLVKSSIKSADILSSSELKKAVNDFVYAAKAEMNEIGEDAVEDFLRTRSEFDPCYELTTSYSLINGYLSVTVGWYYQQPWQDSPIMYYDARCAVFDIYTGERLELSDLFFKDCDFLPMLNSLLAKKSAESYSDFGTTYDMLREYGGLYEGDFEFTADSIIFRPGRYFADGVILSFDELRDYMVTSIPRDMAGYVTADTGIFKDIYTYSRKKIGTAEEKDGITIWSLDSSKGLLSEEVCDKLNSFAYDLFENHFSAEKRLELAREYGYETDRTEIDPYSEMTFILYGNRYITLGGANLLLVRDEDYKVLCDDIQIIPNQASDYYFKYYFNALTGEKLALDDLFTDGWRERTTVQSRLSEVQIDTGFYLTDYTVILIRYFESSPYNYDDMAENPVTPVEVWITDESGDRFTLEIPREFIK